MPTHGKTHQRELVREITVTLLLVILYRIGVQIPIPYLRESGFAFFGIESLERISLLALGLMPYISASILVEICSLFLPFLKKLRKGDYPGRRKLRGYALWMTLFLAVLQSYFLVEGLAGMTSPTGFPALKIGSFYEYAIIVLVLTGGVFFLICIAEVISRYGIGNGLSILLFTGVCAGYSHNIGKMKSLVDGEGLSLFPFFIIFFIVLLAVILLRTEIRIPFKHSALREPFSFFQLNTCPSGNVAIGYATSLIMLPFLLFPSLGRNELFGEISSPGSLIYNVVLVVFIFVLSYLFAYLFLHPRRRFNTMSERGWQVNRGDHNALKNLSRKLLIYNVPWTVLLCLLAIIARVLITRFDVPFYIGGSTFLVVVAVSIDIFDRLNVLRRSKSGALCKIAELHDVYDASIIKRHMESEGITCHFQGYYHRRLLYFLGPYIDMSVMVSEGDREAAEELMRAYHGGLGLLRDID